MHYTCSCVILRFAFYHWQNMEINGQNFRYQNSGEKILLGKSKNDE